MHHAAVLYHCDVLFQSSLRFAMGLYSVSCKFGVVGMQKPTFFQQVS